MKLYRLSDHSSTRAQPVSATSSADPVSDDGRSSRQTDSDTSAYRPIRSFTDRPRRSSATPTSISAAAAPSRTRYSRSQAP